MANSFLQDFALSRLAMKSLRAPVRAVLTNLVPTKAFERKSGIVLCSTAIVLVCSLLLGGGTRGGFLSDAVLELIAIPALFISLASLVDGWQSGTERPRPLWALAFCFSIAFVPLLQLVPLPPWIWTRLPGREEVAGILDLFGRQLPWMPISVSPQDTWMSFLSLLAPLAVFLGVIQLGFRERRALSLVILGVGVVSVFVGLLQVAQGESSSLRFFAITNRDEAVGFFANRNHFAALVYVLLPFTAAWALEIGFTGMGSWTAARNAQPAKIVALTAILTLFVILLAGEAVARSRAGLGLTMVALVGVFALLFGDRRNAFTATPRKLLIAAIVVAFMFIVQFALYRVLDRFADDPLADARITFVRNTIHAATAFMPFGTGVGTFVPVYGMFEKTEDLLANAYANHAHNDILESWLETGIVGPVLMVLFGIWFGDASVKLWRRSALRRSEFDLSLARAATVAIGLLLAHSAVDYPLRTGAMMAIFAFCCALLIEPWSDAAETRAHQEARREETLRPQPPDLPATAIAMRVLSGSVVPSGGESLPPRPRPPAGRWGEDVEWPKEWRRPDNPSDDGK